MLKQKRAFPKLFPQSQRHRIVRNVFRCEVKFESTRKYAKENIITEMKTKFTINDYLESPPQVYQLWLKILVFACINKKYTLETWLAKTHQKRAVRFSCGENVFPVKVIELRMSASVSTVLVAVPPPG